MVLKDFVKLWVSLLKHLVKRYYIDLLELLTFVYQKKPVTCDTKLFAKIVHDCKIRIWILDMAGFVNWPMFIWFQYFIVAQLLIF